MPCFQRCGGDYLHHVNTGLPSMVLLPNLLHPSSLCWDLAYLSSPSSAFPWVSQRWGHSEGLADGKREVRLLPVRLLLLPVLHPARAAWGGLQYPPLLGTSLLQPSRNSSTTGQTPHCSGLSPSLLAAFSQPLSCQLPSAFNSSSPTSPLFLPALVGSDLQQDHPVQP